MKILIAGLPGSGKTTQARKIAEELGFNLFLMGEELRNIAATGSELGNKIKEIMHKGELVDDETVAEVVKQALAKIDSGNIVMEGYPRSINQIKIFDPKFDKVFYLKISEDEQMKRILGRGRSDDTPEAVKKRIEVQAAGLKEVLDFYSQNSPEKKCEVLEVDASNSLEHVYETIKAHLI